MGKPFSVYFPEITISVHKIGLHSHGAILVKILFRSFFYEKKQKGTEALPLLLSLRTATMGECV
jgi:hypothetical protein